MSDVRDGNGRYDRDPEVARRDAEACDLKAQNLSYQQIADRLGISKTAAYESVERALRETVREPADNLRKLAHMQLDELAQQARQVMLSTHYVVDKGAVVLWEGLPLIDDAPVLQAIDRLVRIQERRAKLEGVDAPQRVSIEAQQLGEDVRGLIAALMMGDEEDDEPELDDPDDDEDPDAD